MKLLANLLDTIPNSVKTLVWTLFYQAIVFTADAAIPQLNGLEIDAKIIALIGILLAFASKAAAKKLTRNK